MKSRNVCVACTRHTEIKLGVACTKNTEIKLGMYNMTITVDTFSVIILHSLRDAHVNKKKYYF